jgi:enamine deaminase RidA (YjgF/YER057c/UK114 family)
MDRQNICSGSKWEPIVGYSRAVRVGSHIRVAGTTATDPSGQVVGAGDPYRQAVYILEKIRAALREAGAGLGDVVATRMYVTDISAWQEIGRAHQEFLGQIRPAATMVEVKALVAPEMVVEIEVEAIVGGGAGSQTG